jgi:surfactin synthase thioesterase subunit
LSSESPWIECFSPNPQASIRLLCFPYAGGGARIFRTWSKRLPPWVEVCAVELPGRGSRLEEAPYDSLKPLLADFHGEIGPYLDKPFALFGHSMGGVLAFEFARELRRRGEPDPALLCVSGFGAPQIPRDVRVHYHDLPETEFFERLKKLNGTPPEVLAYPELMQLFLPMIRADLKLIETYRYLPEGPLTCPILVFGGREDEEVPEASLRAWRDQTSASFSLRIFSGGHFFIHSAAEALLKELSAHLPDLGFGG